MITYASMIHFNSFTTLGIEIEVHYMCTSTVWEGVPEN